jgi:hypothetical protein
MAGIIDWHFQTGVNGVNGRYVADAAISTGYADHHQTIRDCPVEHACSCKIG